MNAPIQLAPERLQPSRLWSLWEMLTLKARYFIDLGGEFTNLHSVYYAASLDGGDPLSSGELGAAKQHFETVLLLCRSLGLSTSQELLSHRLDHDTLPKTLEAFEMLRDAVFAELKDHWFVHIPVDRLDFFDTDQIVSYQVRIAFPQATAEIRSAGTSYAMGLPTASVFHAMRAVEIGAQALAAKLEVTFPYSLDLAGLGKVIEEIEGKVNELKKGTRSTEKDASLKFYSEALSQFRHFNNGWRIRAAHSRAVYEDAQAKTVLDHVRAFFEILAEKLSEP